VPRRGGRGTWGLPSATWIAVSGAERLPRTANVIDSELIGVTGPARCPEEPATLRRAYIPIRAAVLWPDRTHLGLSHAPTPFGLRGRRRWNDERNRIAGSRVVVIAMPGLRPRVAGVPPILDAGRNSPAYARRAERHHGGQGQEAEQSGPLPHGKQTCHKKLPLENELPKRQWQTERPAHAALLRFPGGTEGAGGCCGTLPGDLEVVDSTGHRAADRGTVVVDLGPRQTLATIVVTVVRVVVLVKKLMRHQGLIRDVRVTGVSRYGTRRQVELGTRLRAGGVNIVVIKKVGPAVVDRSALGFIAALTQAESAG
jgi:hypothetical protein